MNNSHNIKQYYLYSQATVGLLQRAFNDKTTSKSFLPLSCTSVKEEKQLSPRTGSIEDLPCCTLLETSALALAGFYSHTYVRYPLSDCCNKSHSEEVGVLI